MTTVFITAANDRPGDPATGWTKTQDAQRVYNDLKTQNGGAEVVVGFHGYNGNDTPTNFASSTSDWVPDFPAKYIMINTKSPKDVNGAADWNGAAAGNFNSKWLGMINTMPATDKNGRTITYFWLYDHEPEDEALENATGVTQGSAAFLLGIKAFIRYVLAHRGSKIIIPCFCLMAYTWFTPAAPNPKHRNPADWIPADLTTAEKAQTGALIDCYPKVKAGTVAGTYTVEKIATKAKGLDTYKAAGFTLVGFGEFAVNNNIGAPDQVLSDYYRDQVGPYCKSAGVMVLGWYDSTGAAAGTDPFLRTATRRAGFILGVAAANSTTTDTTAPTAPTGLHVTGVTGSTVSLAWNASTDAVGVTGYKIYRGGTTLAATVIGTTGTVGGLSATTTYSFTVKAVDAAGNTSAASAAVSGTTTTGGTTRTGKARVQLGGAITLAVPRVAQHDGSLRDAQAQVMIGGTLVTTN